MRMMWAGLMLILSGCAASGAPVEEPPRPMEEGTLVLPGPPGASSRVVPAPTTSVEALPYVDADVAFMQGMIVHHAQALEMTALIPSRTSARDVRLLGQRIEASQRGEIQLMEGWLRNRDEALPAQADGRYLTAAHAVHMPGMLTGAQMDTLRAAKGVAFERLFLRLMIQHHEGALVMVETLYSSPGAAQDADVFRFATDVDVDQRAEIRRMQGMLAKRE